MPSATKGKTTAGQKKSKNPKEPKVFIQAKMPDGSSLKAWVNKTTHDYIRNYMIRKKVLLHEVMHLVMQKLGKRTKYTYEDITGVLAD
jgi:hypothetical protein